MYIYVCVSGRDPFTTMATPDPKGNSSPDPTVDSSPVPKNDCSPDPTADSSPVSIADSTSVSKADFFPVTTANSTQGLSPVLTTVLVCGVLVLLILIAAVFIFVRRHKLR